MIQADVSSYVPFDQTDPDNYDRVLGINTKAVFLVTHAAGEIMRSQEPFTVSLGRHRGRDAGRGSIFSVSSAMKLIAVPAQALYTNSKHAVTGFKKGCGYVIVQTLA
jgi:NAD(P)-dependent dehydrogenase (short-subunit alcohol dehydrogenase family)